ncbi:MAG: mechanosensitive ion channel family protein [Planctomycetaceae bacterium]
MRALRSLLAGIGSSAVWPIYLGLMAYTARQAPWPRSLALASSWMLASLAAAAFVASLARWLFRPGGWAEAVLRVPPAVARQVDRAVLVLVAAAVLFLLPQAFLAHGLIAPAGRAVAAPALGQWLGLGFLLTTWGIAYRLARGRSPLVQWLLQSPDRFGWLNRHRRVLASSVLAAFGGMIALDARGYSFTARRMSSGAAMSLVVVASCWGLYRMILRLIEHHAWRWIGVGPAYASGGTPDEASQPDDLAGRLRRLTGYLMPIVGLFLLARVWDIDWALFRFLGEQPLWTVDPKGPTYATVGDVAQAALLFGLTAVSWRHMSTFFAVAVFPRIPEDPGVRFALVTLCRYAVLGVGLLAGLSSIHLGLDKISMVLAALGVGLGFGLQEIVSNFICGIILLLERPIRVGDVVSVSGMSGKVDRINIRATTIINAENQSIIVPNRAFITSDLINWTLKDKIIRVSVRVKVAQGTDPDRVTDLLLSLAREDADVLRNPLPIAFMEDFSDSALNFALHVHVPEPSLGGWVRHRLLTQIQKRFRDAEIQIPLPTQELRVKPLAHPVTGAPVEFPRIDPASPTPPSPRFNKPPIPTPPAVEDCHRGVDE